MLYHDAVAGNVYISENEGKSWDPVKDVPKAAADQLVEHPFNNRYVCSSQYQWWCFTQPLTDECPCTLPGIHPH